MTDRKPPGVDFETWADRQIREAAERGEFENLPGFGKPLPGAGEPYDEMWWVRRKMERENLSFLPPSLALRKEAQEAREAALGARTEAEARRILGHVNERIREAVRQPLSGPPVVLVPLDTEEVLAEWRRRHDASEPPAP
ncbi:DUF1992 domain-containing protein [Streptomyces sp. NPDC059740]|uniref:DnaJ family domain-containing protein n=1 Tax=Streptomyces sp. NPDC059740 TaxID=3346926 RepID=UPI003646038A